MKNDSDTTLRNWNEAFRKHIQEICPEAYNDERQASLQLNQANNGCAQRIREVDQALNAIINRPAGERITAPQLETLETTTRTATKNLQHYIQNIQANVDAYQKDNSHHQQWIQTLEDKRAIYLEHARRLAILVEKLSPYTGFAQANATSNSITCCIRNMDELNHTIQNIITIVNQPQSSNYTSLSASL